MTALTDAPPIDHRPLAALPTGRARTIALFSLFLASTMELLDTTIVNVALPSIETGLGATGAQLQWMVAAYPLAFAVALITGSRLGDLWGRKHLFVVGLVGFTLMSAACGLAPNAETLILFRALQGLAAAAMIPQVLTSIQVMYAPHERAAAMGLFTGLAGVTAVVGPVLGAVLTNADIAGTGWRSIFLVNVPVGVLAIVAAVKWVPNSISERRPGIDVRGVLVLAAGLLAVLYPLTMGRELGWPVWGYALIAAGVVTLVAFVRHQQRTEREGREPLVALSLYRLRSFGAGSGVHGLLFVAMGATFLCQTVYLQAGLGWTVLHAGLAGLPFAVATVDLRRHRHGGPRPADRYPRPPDRRHRLGGRRAAAPRHRPRRDRRHVDVGVRPRLPRVGCRVRADGRADRDVHHHRRSGRRRGLGVGAAQHDRPARQRGGSRGRRHGLLLGRREQRRTGGRARCSVPRSRSRSPSSSSLMVVTAVVARALPNHQPAAPSAAPSAE